MAAREHYTLLDGGSDKVSLVASVLKFVQDAGGTITDQKIEDELGSYNMNTPENFQKVREYLTSDV